MSYANTTPQESWDENTLDYLESVLLNLPTAIFVESRASQSAGASINCKVHYEVLLRYLKDVCQLAHAKYYWSNGLREEDISSTKFLKYLRHVGWDIWSSPAADPHKFTDEGTVQNDNAIFNPKIKLAVDAMAISQRGIQQVILFVRGADYQPLIDTLQAQGIRVVAVTWTDSNKGTANKLDLRQIQDSIGSYRAGPGVPVDE